VFLAYIGLAMATSNASHMTMIDYALPAQVDSWLRHPVLGDPSFDSFKRFPNNPIYRGSGEFCWPVNGYLFIDPKSRNWYACIGEYKAGYGGGQSRCVLLRSKDQGASWQNLGPCLQGSKEMFDKDGHTPDVSVVYDKGRYHMVYDWGEKDFNDEGGLAYAWADKPEGPWHRAAQPITRNSKIAKIDGRYSRTYGGTLIKRKNDWLILLLLDHAPTSWTLAAMVAKKPEGPYSAPRIVRQVERDEFHPAPVEFYPQFVHRGYVYATAPSVAANRNFDCMFRAPVESADRPEAWKLYRHGSLWHAEDAEWEFAGQWGQVFSGQVLPDGRLVALSFSRDKQNCGAVSLSSRPWSQPFRSSGFVLTGHAGPSIALLNRQYGDFELNAKIKTRGTAQIVWGYRGLLGPDQPTSDSGPSESALANYSALQVSDKQWAVRTVDAKGNGTTVATGETDEPISRVEIVRTGDTARLKVGGNEVWKGPVHATNGPIGLIAGPDTHVEVEKFEVEGEPKKAVWTWNCTEALLGAGESTTDWKVESSPLFQYGQGAIRNEPGGAAKWNFIGSGFRLFSPTAPEVGKVKVVLDGREIAVLNLNSKEMEPSKVVLSRARLRQGPHSLVLKPISGRLVVDCLEVTATGSLRQTASALRVEHPTGAQSPR